MKLAGIYSPYWDTLGGGEKYVAFAMHAYGQAGYRVELLWHDKSILKKLKSRYSINLDSCRVNTASYDVFKKGSTIQVARESLRYCSFLFVSDGSLPTLFSSQVLVHFQVPFSKVNGKSFTNKVRNILSRPTFIANSCFTKQVIDSEFGISSDVLYPPAQMISCDKGKKEQMILTVGRFDNLMQSKRQDVLIDAFLEGEFSKKWKLVLAGGVLHNPESVDRLRKAAGSNKHIEIMTNISWDKMVDLYQRASIYWHAAGFDTDEKLFPEKMEHFGISVVEAMSAGGVPIVYSGGGLREIVNIPSSGILWKSKDDLISSTKALIGDRKLWGEMSMAAQDRAKQFSSERFCDTFKTLVS